MAAILKTTYGQTALPAVVPVRAITDPVSSLTIAFGNVSPMRAGAKSEHK